MAPAGRRLARAPTPATSRQIHKYNIHLSKTTFSLIFAIYIENLLMSYKGNI